MKLLIKKMLYAVLAVLLVLVFYMIFNAGNPNSILRFVISDPAYDISATVGLSILIAAISLAMASERNQTSLRQLLKNNEAHVRLMREQGLDERSIAVSFVNELGVRKRIVRRLIERRVRRLLKKMG